MFRRRTGKKSASLVAEDSAVVLNNHQNLDSSNSDKASTVKPTEVVSTTSTTRPSVASTAVSIYDEEDEEMDLPISQRMQRNLFVSRSGRYKSKARQRANLQNFYGTGTVVAGTPSTQTVTSLPTNTARGDMSKCGGAGQSAGVVITSSVPVPAASSCSSTIGPGPYSSSAVRGLSTAV